MTSDGRAVGMLEAAFVAADLMGAIEAQPDDEAGFLVYADWMIEHGDPRGELVMLQRAAREDPSRSEEAGEFLRRHRDRLLGPLAQLGSDVRLEWRLGFVHAVQITTRDQDRVAAMLEAVVAAPACVFLRRLELRGTWLGQIDYGPFDAQLAALARPRTLERIVLGRPGEHLASDALRAAYPRFDVGTHWDDVERGVADPWNRIEVENSADLPVVVARDGRPIPLDGATLLSAFVLDHDDDNFRLVERIAAACEPDVLDRYAATLLERVCASEMIFEPEKQMPARLAKLVTRAGGRETALSLSRQLADVDRQWFAQDLFCLLWHMTTPVARLELFLRLRQPTKALDHTRRPYELDTDTLLDTWRSWPETSYDRDVLDHLVVIGWTTRLDIATQLRARASCAPLIWAHARPERRSLRERVLGRDVPVEPFQLAAAGPCDREGRAIAVGADEPIWLVHPLELEDDQLESWRAWQCASTPVLAQLDRPSPLERARRPALAALRPLLGRAPGADLLRRCGFYTQMTCQRLMTPRLTQDPTSVMRRACWYRGVPHVIQIDLETPRPVCVTGGRVPPVVVHELARALAAARLGSDP